MSSTIELNGKRYDARTGKIIGEALASPAAKPAPREHTGAVLDGFTKRPGAFPALHPAAKPKPATSNAQLNPARRNLEKSGTLMRKAVKKPTVTAKNDIQKSPVKPIETHTARHARAETHQKSPLISKFNSSNTRSAVTKKQSHLPVAQAKGAVRTTETQIADRLRSLEHAVESGTAHLQQLEHGVVRRASFLNRVGFKSKVGNLATMSLAVLLLGGFFAYQNLAALEMRVAATRSGVSAKLPAYKPAGYGVVNGVKSEPGKVAVSFVSRTDNSKNFTVTQESSNWTSSTLLANHVTRGGKPYQTYQNDGKTVYIYDNSNATWVDKGIWYQVEGNASLTSDQLLRLSNSF